MPVVGQAVFDGAGGSFLGNKFDSMACAKNPDNSYRFSLTWASKASAFQGQASWLSTGDISVVAHYVSAYNSSVAMIWPTSTMIPTVCVSCPDVRAWVLHSTAPMNYTACPSSVQGTWTGIQWSTTQDDSYYSSNYPYMLTINNDSTGMFYDKYYNVSYTITAMCGAWKNGQINMNLVNTSGLPSSNNNNNNIIGKGVWAWSMAGDMTHAWFAVSNNYQNASAYVTVPRPYSLGPKVLPSNSGNSNTNHKFLFWNMAVLNSAMNFSNCDPMLFGNWTGDQLRSTGDVYSYYSNYNMTLMLNAQGAGTLAFGSAFGTPTLTISNVTCMARPDMMSAYVNFVYTTAKAPTPMSLHAVVQLSPSGNAEISIQTVDTTTGSNAALPFFPFNLNLPDNGATTGNSGNNYYRFALAPVTPMGGACPAAAVGTWQGYDLNSDGSISYDYNAYNFTIDNGGKTGSMVVVTYQKTTTTYSLTLSCSSASAMGYYNIDISASAPTPFTVHATLMFLQNSVGFYIQGSSKTFARPSRINPDGPQYPSGNFPYSPSENGMWQLYQQVNQTVTLFTDACPDSFLNKWLGYQVYNSDGSLYYYYEYEMGVSKDSKGAFTGTWAQNGGDSSSYNLYCKQNSDNTTYQVQARFANASNVISLQGIFRFFPNGDLHMTVSDLTAMDIRDRPVTALPVDFSIPASPSYGGSTGSSSPMQSYIFTPAVMKPLAGACPASLSGDYTVFQTDASTGSIQSYTSGNYAPKPYTDLPMITFKGDGLNGMIGQIPVTMKCTELPSLNNPMKSVFLAQITASADMQMNVTMSFDPNANVVHIANAFQPYTTSGNSIWSPNAGVYPLLPNTKNGGLTTAMLVSGSVTAPATLPPTPYRPPTPQVPTSAPLSAGSTLLPSLAASVLALVVAVAY